LHLRPGGRQLFVTTGGALWTRTAATLQRSMLQKKKEEPPCWQVGPVNDVMSQSHMRELQSWMHTPPFAHVVALQ